MAISIRNFVDISTTFPTAAVAGRSFGGLVFTTKAMNAGVTDELDAIVAKYDDGEALQLSLDEIKSLFTEASDEYKFAEGYYDYISPSGNFASKLTFAKVNADEDALTAFNRVRGETNLFGSFTFLSTKSGDDADAELTELVAVAEENDKLDARFLFVVNNVWNPKTAGESAKVVANRDKFVAADGTYFKGTCFVAGAAKSSACMPMAILAATDYADGSVVNYMFKQFSKETATVKDDATYTLFNKNYVNFYGRTQTNGQTLDFFQRGFNSDGTDTAVFCNEMWFKSVCETALMDLLINSDRVSADAYGVNSVRSVVLEQCSDGVSNGMFSIKEASTDNQKALRTMILNIGGSNEDVQNILTGVATVGYSVYAYLAVKSDDDDGKLAPGGEYIIRYMVFYGTSDSIRHIKGDDILIK